MKFVSDFVLSGKDSVFNNAMILIDIEFFASTLRVNINAKKNYPLKNKIKSFECC